MSADVSFEQRCREQEAAIARLTDECQTLRAENAGLRARLEAARDPVAVNRMERLEATLPAGPEAPATAAPR